MPLFSPGPWEYDESSGTIRDDFGRVVIEGVGCDDGPLIAAAPEMLQLLRDATDCEGREELVVVLAAARRLIARLGNG